MFRGLVIVTIYLTFLAIVLSASLACSEKRFVGYPSMQKWIDSLIISIVLLVAIGGFCLWLVK